MPFSSKATTSLGIRSKQKRDEQTFTSGRLHQALRTCTWKRRNKSLGLLRGLSVTSGIDASDIRLRYTSRSLSGTGALRFDLLAAL
ncbi:hypothetical protein KCU70_g307, partial [Aureobasidium melanogenum]